MCSCSPRSCSLHRSIVIGALIGQFQTRPNSCRILSNVCSLGNSFCDLSAFCKLKIAFKISACFLNALLLCDANLKFPSVFLNALCLHITQKARIQLMPFPCLFTHKPQLTGGYINIISYSHSKFNRKFRSIYCQIMLLFQGVFHS